MAQGTVVAFDQWMVDLAEALMDHELGTFYMALVNNTSGFGVSDDEAGWKASDQCPDVQP